MKKYIAIVCDDATCAFNTRKAAVTWAKNELIEDEELNSSTSHYACIKEWDSITCKSRRVLELTLEDGEFTTKDIQEEEKKKLQKTCKKLNRMI